MNIRSEDVRAIVTAVEWIVDGTLSEVRIQRMGRTIFAARLKEDALQIDPNVIPPALAKRLLNETQLLGGGPGSSTDESHRARQSGKVSRSERHEPQRSKTKSTARV